MKRVQQGFTLIELMIVVAIIGILAAVAIPQYKNYTMKAKLGNATTSVDSVKTAVALCVQETGTNVGCTGGTNGIPSDTTAAPTNEVASITTKDGQITAVLNSTLATGIGATPGTAAIVWNPNIAGANALTWAITTAGGIVDPYLTMITKNSSS